jgi:O-antigen/teichoic acid export membrane protein
VRAFLANAAYGMLDYAAHPIGMLLVAPIVLRNMGTAQYGVWAVATAAVSMGSIIASGFGDANIQHVASQRSVGNLDALVPAVRSMIGINLILGTVLSFIAWMLAPYAAHHIASSDAALQRDCLCSLRIVAALIWLRTMESVCICTQRAFERYGAAVRISIFARVLSLIAAAALTYVSHTVTSIVAATALLSLLATWLQFKHLRHLLHVDSLTPSFDRNATKAILGFGVFSWLQAVCGVIFGQADRLLLGVSMGAVTVASYAVCTQMAQPIYGFAASGLHFLFPYLTRQNASRSPSALPKTIFAAFTCNFLFVTAATFGLLLFGVRILRIWVGGSIAQSSVSILPIIVLGSALLGLNVTGTYSLLAIGRVRTVTWLNVGGGTAMMLLMIALLPYFGMYGMAAARICYGATTLLLYIPLIHQLRQNHAARLPEPAVASVNEEA